MDFEKIIRFAQTLDHSGESVGKLYSYLLNAFELEKPEERNFQRSGILITFDGHSGAGKDTQIAMLKKHMQKRAYDRYKVVELIQKRNDPFRQVPKYLWAHPEVQSAIDCSLLLLTAGRRYFVYHTVLPLLEDPQAVLILNRSYLSNAAYHASNKGELPALVELSDFDPNPDMAFILECNTDVAFSRVIRRAPEKGGVVYNNEKPDYIERVKENFRGLAALVNGLIFVDTSGNPELAAQEIFPKVDTYFKQRK